MRLNVLRHLLTRLDGTGVGEDVDPPEPEGLFEFGPEALARLAR
jgi:hypothetical protein